MIQALIELFFGLVPDEHATPLAHKLWRKRVGKTLAMLVLVSLGTVIAILTFWGKFPYLDSPFASKYDLDVSTAQQKAQLLTASNQLEAKMGATSDAVTRLGDQARFRYSEQIDSNILDALAKCHDAKTADARRLYIAQVSHLIEQYRLNNEGRDPPTDGGCVP